MAEKKVKRIVPTELVVGAFAFLLSLALFLYWSSISPTAPDPATGHICSLNNHGHIFYVTTTETVVYHTLLIGGWSLIACGIVHRLWLEHRMR
jgi:hypothetical protein